MINEELNSIDLSNDEAPTPDLDGQGSENPSNEEITADKENADKKSCFLLNPKFLLGSNIVLFVAIVILLCCILIVKQTLANHTLRHVATQ